MEAVGRKFSHWPGNPATVGVVRWPSAGDTTGYKLRRPKLTPVYLISMAWADIQQCHERTERWLQLTQQPLFALEINQFSPLCSTHNEWPFVMRILNWAYWPLTAAINQAQLGFNCRHLQLHHAFTWRIQCTGWRLIFAAGGLITVVSVECIVSVF